MWAEKRIAFHAGIDKSKGRKETLKKLGEIVAADSKKSLLGKYAMGAADVLRELKRTVVKKPRRTLKEIIDLESTKVSEEVDEK